MTWKYVGTLMPVLLGFCGAFGLLDRFTMAQARFYLVQIAIILYPPFAIFSVSTTIFFRKGGKHF